MKTKKQIQEEKISLLKQIATTSNYSMSKSAELHSEYDALTKEQMGLILQDSGYDFQWTIGEPQIIGLLKIAFALGKKEQADIYKNGIVK